MIRVIGAQLLAGAVLLSLAPAALGHGVLRREGDVLRYTASDPRVGAALTISSPSPGRVEFFDSKSPGGMDWGPCLPLSERRSRCPLRGISEIEVQVYDGNDVVRARIATPVWVIAGTGNDRIRGGYGADELDAGSGDDLLVGGGGKDLFLGGEGADRIEARDGVPEQINCGLGFDQVEADERDTAFLGLLDCEGFDSSPASPDRDAPTVRLVAPRPLRLDGGLALPTRGWLDEPGSIRLGGSLILGGRKVARLIPDTARPNAPGQRWSLRPQISDRIEPRLLRRLDAGKRAFVRLMARAEDRAGNRSSRRLRVRLVP